MSDLTTPNDVKKYTLIIFTAFVVVFVFAMLMMLWQGNFYLNDYGERRFNTRIVWP